MTDTVPRSVLHRLRKLAQLPEEARQCRFAVSITRLTVLKSLCQEPEVANRFVTFLAQRTQQKVQGKAKRPGHLSVEVWARHREMIEGAVTALQQYLDRPSEERRAQLWSLFQELAGEQNEYRRVYGGPVRQITDNDLLLVEYAVRTVLADDASTPLWAYQTARCYAEHSDASHGTGLTPASAPLVQDIADFWMKEFGLDPESLKAPTRTKSAANDASSATRRGKGSAHKHERRGPSFTHRQGQFLTFIYWYTKLHRQAPSELDLVVYFRLTPPSVHSMIVKLHQLGLITRQPGKPRSIRVAIPEEEIPRLEDVAGPPW